MTSPNLEAYPEIFDFVEGLMQSFPKSREGSEQLNQ